MTHTAAALRRPSHAPGLAGRLVLLCLPWVALGSAPAALASDVEAGKLRAQQACVVCHGPLGISSTPDAPNLAGQPAIYLAAQLRAYKNGSRRHEVMAVISRMLSDEDISNLAAWYAAIRVEAQAPR